MTNIEKFEYVKSRIDNGNWHISLYKRRVRNDPCIELHCSECSHCMLSNKDCFLEIEFTNYAIENGWFPWLFL